MSARAVWNAEQRAPLPVSIAPQVGTSSPRWGCNAPARRAWTGGRATRGSSGPNEVRLGGSTCNRQQDLTQIVSPTAPLPHLRWSMRPRAGTPPAAQGRKEERMTLHVIASGPSGDASGELAGAGLQAAPAGEGWVDAMSRTRPRGGPDWGTFVSAPGRPSRAISISDCLPPGQRAPLSGCRSP